MYFEYKPKKSILVVEDDEHLREALVSLVNLYFSEDIFVVQAKDGVEASQKISNQRFHCIITDVSMPRKNGGEFIDTIRKSIFNEFTPIIVISGVVDKTFARKFPFVYFISKPFNSVSLAGLIGEQISSGSIKKRLSASVLSDIVGLLSEFLCKLTGAPNTEVGMVSSKSRSQPLPADFCGMLRVEVDKVKNIFCIFGRDTDFKKIRSHMENELSVEELFESMSKVILQHIIKLHSLGGATFDPMVDLNSPGGKRLVDSTGVIVPVICAESEIELSIFASNR